MSYTELARIPGWYRNRQVELEEMADRAWAELQAADVAAVEAAQMTTAARLRREAAWTAWTEIRTAQNQADEQGRVER